MDYIERLCTALYGNGGDPPDYGNDGEIHPELDDLYGVYNTLPKDIAKYTDIQEHERIMILPSGKRVSMYRGKPWDMDLNCEFVLNETEERENL